MDLKRRDVLGAGMALGLGVAAGGVVAQEGGGGGGGGQAGRRGAGGAAGGRGGAAAPAGGGGLLHPPVNRHVQPSSVDFNYKPRRVNKAIELWEDGQPIYYSGSGLGPGVDPYAQGVRMSQTYMDAINVEMEHGCLDFMQVREFMRGLVDGGPTRSGHRTPAVIVETCIIGLDANYMRANSWVLQQWLDAGIHGVHICHAQNSEAIKVATQMACRYPFPRTNLKTPYEMRGLRGSSASYAAQIWGVNQNTYNHIADLWPNNPQGEIIFGVKIEDTIADQDADKTLALPGVSMAEFGQGDHAYWIYGLDIMPIDGSRPPEDVVTRPEMVKVHENVRDLCKKNGVIFSWGTSADPNNPNFILTCYKDGSLVFEANEDAAILGREYTKRKMPV